MPELTPMDELFVHQIPEPLPNVGPRTTTGARACSSSPIRATGSATS